METYETGPIPDVFTPHPNLSDQVNRNIVQSEIEGGVLLDNLPAGEVLEVETQNHWYVIINCGDGTAFISGHPAFCPQPTRVRIQGSTWGGSMLKMRFIGRGMRLEFCHPVFRTIVTSRIMEIRPREHRLMAREIAA